MNSTSVNYFSDKQILWVQDSGSLFQATVTPPDYEVHLKIQYHLNHLVILLVHLYRHLFDGVKTLTLFGQELSGSDQISMSVDLSSFDWFWEEVEVVVISLQLRGSGMLGGSTSGEQ